MQIASGSFGFEDNTVFVDHENVTIIERVENEIGGACLDCNVSLTLLYPNGSMYVTLNFNMTLLNTTGYYNATLFNATTLGVYPLLINATRDSSNGLFNATSDRSFIRVVDVYPEPQSNWEVGMVGGFVIMGFILFFISTRIDSLPQKQLFFMLAITMPLLSLSALYNAMNVNLGSSADSTTIVGRLVIGYSGIYLFLFFISVLMYYKDILIWIKGSINKKVI